MNRNFLFCFDNRKCIYYIIHYLHSSFLLKNKFFLTNIRLHLFFPKVAIILLKLKFLFMKMMEYLMFLEYWWSLSEYKDTLSISKNITDLPYTHRHKCTFSLHKWQNTLINTQKVCVFTDALSFPYSFTKICSHRLANTHRKINKDTPWTVLWNEYIFSRYSTSHKD